MPPDKTTLSYRLLPIAHVMGMMIMFFSLAYLPPLLWSFAVNDGMQRPFLLSALANFSVGSAIWLATRKYAREIRPRDGFLIVSLVGFVLGSSAAVPFLLNNPSMSFIDAFFEAVSGLTTTGATVIKGLDTLAPSLNLWRHELSWLGGMGIIGLAMAVLPLLGVGGMQVYKAHASGPIKDKKLTPRIEQTAKTLWLIYLAMTSVCFISLKIAGMSWLDAICHAFTALSLGGFSTHDASIGYFNSPFIELILMGFMLISGINFATHFASWRMGNIKPYQRDAEMRWYLRLIFIAFFWQTIYLWATHIYPNPFTALRHASFNVISIASGAGFFSADYSQWPIFATLLMLLLSCVSASAGSTGGGIKMVRTMTLFKQSHREIRQLLHPSAITPLKIGAETVQERVVMSVLGFIHLYAISIVIFTFLLLLSGLDFLSSFSAVMATLNNVGPGLGVVAPIQTYQGLSDFQTFICTLSMLVGRLEIFVFIVPFTRGFWRE